MPSHRTYKSYTPSTADVGVGVGVGVGEEDEGGVGVGDGAGYLYAKFACWQSVNIDDNIF